MLNHFEHIGILYTLLNGAEGRCWDELQDDLKNLSEKLELSVTELVHIIIEGLRREVKNDVY